MNTTTLSIVAGPVTARNFKEISALATVSAEERQLENYFSPDKEEEYEEFCSIYDYETFMEDVNIQNGIENQGEE